MILFYPCRYNYIIKENHIMLTWNKKKLCFFKIWVFENEKEIFENINSEIDLFFMKIFVEKNSNLGEGSKQALILLLLFFRKFSIHTMECSSTSNPIWTLLHLIKTQAQYMDKKRAGIAHVASEIECPIISWSLSENLSLFAFFFLF